MAAFRSHHMLNKVARRFHQPTFKGGFSSTKKSQRFLVIWRCSICLNQLDGEQKCKKKHHFHKKNKQCGCISKTKHDFFGAKNLMFPLVLVRIVLRVRWIRGFKASPQYLKLIKTGWDEYDESIKNLPSWLSLNSKLSIIEINQVSVFAPPRAKISPSQPDRIHAALDRELSSENPEVLLFVASVEKWFRLVSSDWNPFRMG